MPEFLSTHPTDKRRIALINRYLARAQIDYNTSKVKYGLGKTIHYREAVPDNDKNESTPKSPKPVPDISIETLTQLEADYHPHVE